MADGPRAPWYLRAWWWPLVLLWCGVVYLVSAGPVIYLWVRGHVPIGLREAVSLAYGPAAMLGSPPEPRVEWYARYMDSFRLPERRYYGEELP